VHRSLSQGCGSTAEARRTAEHASSLSRERDAVLARGEAGPSEDRALRPFIPTQRSNRRRRASRDEASLHAAILAGANGGRLAIAAKDPFVVRNTRSDNHLAALPHGSLGAARESMTVS